MSLPTLSRRGCSRHRMRPRTTGRTATYMYWPTTSVRISTTASVIGTRRSCASWLTVEAFSMTGTRLQTSSGRTNQAGQSQSARQALPPFPRRSLYWPLSVLARSRSGRAPGFPCFRGYPEPVAFQETQKQASSQFRPPLFPGPSNGYPPPKGRGLRRLKLGHRRQ